jgi:hypothetical protein
MQWVIGLVALEANLRLRHLVSLLSLISELIKSKGVLIRKY